MIKNAKKTDTEKQLIKFRNEFHKLLTKYPDVKITSDMDGDIRAWIRTGDAYRQYDEIYLPTSGKQELISK